MNNEHPQCHNCSPHQSFDEPQECVQMDAVEENYFFDEDKAFNENDPLAPSISAARWDLLARIFLGFCAAAIAWHEISNLMAVLAFLYVFFFAPRMTSHRLHLKSGRTVKEVRPILTRALISGRHAGKKALDVYYTCCTDDTSSRHLHREFDDMVAAVLQSCERRKLNFAEITAELPIKRSFFSLNNHAPVARSAQFALDAQGWRPVEVPLVPERT